MPPSAATLAAYAATRPDTPDGRRQSRVDIMTDERYALPTTRRRPWDGRDWPPGTWFKIDGL